VKPGDLACVHGVGASYVEHGIEICLRCDGCGCPVLESRRKWPEDQDLQPLNDTLPSPRCPECVQMRANDGSEGSKFRGANQ
jgi:hypothetical protein